MPSDEVDFDLAAIDRGLVEAEIEHHLHLKGYCVIGSVMSYDTLYESLGDIRDMRAENKFQPPPQAIVEGLLGPEGSSEMAYLTIPDETDYPEGDLIRRVDEGLSDLAENCSRFMTGHGLLSMLRSPSVLIRGGTPDFEGPELTEELCSHWISTFNQAKLTLLIFIGPNDGVLELQPFADEECGSVDITTTPTRAVIFRSDMLGCKHCASSMDYTICCWITSQETMTGPRGWLSSSGAGKGMTVMKELQDWATKHLEELYQHFSAGTLDESIVPREWLRMMHHQYFRQDRTPIAVCGQAGHLPTSSDNEAVWKAINAGADMAVTVPLHRWEHETYYDADPNSWMQSQFFAGGTVRTAVRHCSFIDGIEMFDSRVFGLSQTEAKVMDPMQRHVLETSYECMYDSGMKKKEMFGAFVAVYTGSSNPEWSYILGDQKVNEFSITASSQTMLSTRTSYVLGLKGPSTSIDCEMASSAMAIMSGAGSIAKTSEQKTQSGQDSDAACCSGVYFALTPVMWPRHGAFMDHKGRCFTFDASANGYVRGELCASVCLKPYTEPSAETADMDGIQNICYGTLAGWRMANSGRAASLTAPCGPAEQAACREAVENAGITVLDIDAVECQGIASLLPDGVEVTSLASVLRGKHYVDQESLVLGAVKTNMGAQCEACGMMQFMKVIFNIIYGNNTPSLHLRQLNPHFEMGQAAILMSQEPAAYRERSVFHQLASRGLGGTNVNLILWYSADGTRVAQDKPEMERQDFNFWPGGGGHLRAESRPAEGYFIVGSWSPEGQHQEMDPEGDGRYSFTVTLGMSGFESFQIWLDSEDERVLHPSVPNAPSGSAVLGPSLFMDAEAFSWRIDGRDPGYGMTEKLALEDGASRRPYQSRDSGKPGDKYEVTLHTAGKYRAVTWQKEKDSEPTITEAMLAGKYYITGPFNGYSFQEMEASTDTPGLYTAEVGPLPRRGIGHEFQICRNKDWNQIFYPGSVQGQSGAEVLGPDDHSDGMSWSLRPTQSSDIFRVEFRRTLEGGEDARTLTWSTIKAKGG